MKLIKSSTINILEIDDQTTGFSTNSYGYEHELQVPKGYAVRLSTALKDKGVKKEGNFITTPDTGPLMFFVVRNDDLKLIQVQELTADITVKLMPIVLGKVTEFLDKAKVATANKANSELKKVIDVLEKNWDAIVDTGVELAATNWEKVKAEWDAIEVDEKPKE